MQGNGANKHFIIGALAFAILGAAWLFSGLGGVPSAYAQTQRERLPLNSTVALVAKTDLLGQPASDGPLVLSLPANSRGTVLGGPFNDGDWYWIDFAGGTRGYVPARALTTNLTAVPTGTVPPGTRTPEPATPTPTQDPILGAYTGLMLGELNTGGNVRVAPGTENRKLKSWPKARRVLLYERAKDGKGEFWIRVSEPPEEPMWVHADLIKTLAPVKFEAAKFKGKWINVSISQQIVTAYEGAKPMKVTLASTGTLKDPTELGVWKIYHRLPKQDMEGGNLASDDYYSLKDVPYPQYFHYSGEGFHGTYWHDSFGYRRSHGCVNLSTPMSEWLYGWAKIGTDVWVHE